MEIRMPKLSDTMEEGEIIAWLRSDGDRVYAGDILAHIASDKATFDLLAKDAGYLRIFLSPGGSAPIGAVIGEVTESLTPEATPPRVSVATFAEPGGSAEDNDISVDTGVEAILTRRTGRASPLARRTAASHGLDLADIRGSGQEGLVTKEDVLAAVASRDEGPPTGAISSDVARVEGASGMHKAVAALMTQSKTTVPHFYLSVEIRMEPALAMLESLRDSGLAEHHPTITHMVIRACGLALGRHPALNRSWVDGQFIYRARRNIAVAVSVGEGLVAPVVRDVDTKVIAAVVKDTQALVARARARELSAADLAGASLTVSSLGGRGIDQFFAIVHPPEAGIVAIGAAQERPVIERGMVVVGTAMFVNFSFDHRAVYGAEASEFVGDVRDLMQHPEKWPEFRDL
jgi:pyruvate dehydrogenase E2 component (dihydrolipoamide acetyltransferase)